MTHGFAGDVAGAVGGLDLVHVPARTVVDAGTRPLVLIAISANFSTSTLLM